MISSATASCHDHDHFPALAEAVRRTFATAKGPLFTTAAIDLFATYLSGFDADEVQHHNCHACRRFIEQFGSLVTIDEEGRTRSVFWNIDVPPIYARSIDRLHSAVVKAEVTGVFLSELPTWGTGPTPDKKRGFAWTHFDVISKPFKHPLLTAGQVMAERLEEFGMLSRGVLEFNASVVALAKALLETEQLYRAEKMLGVATWLFGIHASFDRTRNEKLRRNILWRAVASAPPGWCHIKSTMIGTLLEDLAAGLDFDLVKRRFADKMHPLQYQRAQVPPSEGNVAQAEAIVAKLRTAGALARRFAKLEDVVALWRPRPAALKVKSVGVFGHVLRPRVAWPPFSDVGDVVKITWEKFARTALPSAERVEFMVPAHGAFIALVTAADPEAPPVLQWDREDKRNPVSWYVYSGGSPARRWNLDSSTWVNVTAITGLPSAWDAENPLRHQGDGVILLLDGARDTTHTRSGGLFTESLRSEYHAVRRTLEAYMMQATIAGKDEATACGYDLRKGGSMNASVRVTSGGLRQQYLIDRWD